MSGRVGTWQCRSCGAELATVMGGALYPRVGVPVRLDPDGTGVLTCPTATCRRPRVWAPRPQQPRDVVRSS